MITIKNLLSAGTLVLFAASAYAEQQVEKIDSLMQAAHARGFFNGNVLVAREGQVIYQNEIGYADASKTTGLQPHTRFNVGSISKELDSVGLMMLAEEGKLQLHDAVAAHIPGLPEWSEKVTIHNLLKYTSGLPKVEYDRHSPFTDADAMRFLRGLEKLEFTPGTGHIYSNYNTFLRRRVIESASGQSYGAFLRDQIFEPYGMDGAVVEPTPETPHVAKAFDNELVEDDYPRFMSGWIYLTAEDLYQWGRHLHAYDIISRESLLTLAEGYQQERPAIGTVQVKGGAVAMHWHAGSSYNFESSHYVNPSDGFSVILMTNNKGFNVGDLTNGIAAILRGNDYEMPKKSLYMALRTEIFYRGFESGKKLLERISSDESDLYDANIQKALAKTGRYLLGVDKVQDAIKLLDYAKTQYPGDARFPALLGNIHRERGDRESAIQNYKKASALDPDNANIKGSLEALRAGA